MVTARTPSLIELKKKQWAREKEELSGFQGIWANLRKEHFNISRYDERSVTPRIKTAGLYNSSNLPPIISNHHYEQEEGEERGGDTSGYASETGYEITNNNPQYIKPEPFITQIPYRCGSESGDWISSGWRSGGEERARWGERGVGVGRLWTPNLDIPSCPDTPAWSNRAIREGGAEVLVISHEDGSGTMSSDRSSEARLDSADTDNTRILYLDGRNHVRGQNVPLPPEEMEDRIVKRQKALQHQQAIKEQLEEKERLKREERERELLEEAKAEERLRRQQLIEKQRYLQEQMKIKEKQEKEERKAKAMKEALEEAERKAKEEKIKQRMKHVNKDASCVRTAPQIRSSIKNEVICEVQDNMYKQEFKSSSSDERKIEKFRREYAVEVKSNSPEECHRKNERYRRDFDKPNSPESSCRKHVHLPNFDTCRRNSNENVYSPRRMIDLERNKEEFCQRVNYMEESSETRTNPVEEIVCCSSNEVSIDKGVNNQVINNRDKIVEKDVGSIQNVVSHRCYQSFSVVAAPSVDPSPMRPLSPHDSDSIREILAARNDSLNLGQLDETVLRALEALKTSDPIVEIESSQLRLIATPEQGRLLTPSKYRPTRWTEKATQTDNSKRRLRGVQRLEERPKWGVNRPERKFIKASDRDPFRSRNVRMRRTNSQDDQDTSRSSSPGQEPTYPGSVKPSIAYTIRAGFSKPRKMTSKGVCTPKVIRLNVRRDSQNGLVRTNSAVKRLLAISAYQQNKPIAVSSNEGQSSNLLSVQDLLSQISALKQGLYMKQKEWEPSRSQTPFSEDSTT